MRKTIFANAPAFCLNLFCFAFLGFTTIPLSAQDATPAKETPAIPAMPRDPKQLMLLAARSNGLTGPDVQPWHLKATCKMLDEKGNVTGQGTYEEFWASPIRYKLTYTDPSSAESYYGTDSGTLRSGGLDSALEPLVLIRNELVSPISVAEYWLEHLSSDQRTRDRAGNKLLCLGMQGHVTPEKGPHLAAPAYCFDTNLPVLRISVKWGEISQFVHNNIVSFQGRYLPGDLDGLRAEKPVLKVHLDAIETLQAISDADFASAPDALPWPPQLTISSAEAQQLQLDQPAPVYPPIAMAARVQGTVVLKAIIGKNGRVLSLNVISGPAMLQQAALDAVKKWTYRPYLLSTKPADVSTTINVVFSLGSHPHATS